MCGVIVHSVSQYDMGIEAHQHINVARKHTQSSRNVDPNKMFAHILSPSVRGLGQASRQQLSPQRRHCFQHMDLEKTIRIVSKQRASSGRNKREKILSSEWDAELLHGEAKAAAQEPISSDRFRSAKRLTAGSKPVRATAITRRRRKSC